MNNKNNSIIARCVSITVAALLACMLLIQLLISMPTHQSIENQPETDNMILTPDKGNGITLNVQTLSTDETLQKTLTATVGPDTATNKLMDWKVDWKDSTSEWATGKTVTDYVTVTAESDGSTTATAECLQAFGEQIIITVQSRENPEIKATCTSDFAQKLTNASLKFGALDVVLGGQTDVMLEINPTGVGPGGATAVTLEKGDVYTIAEEFTYTVTSNTDLRTTTGEELYFELNGDIFTRIANPYNDLTSYDLTETGYYFDYQHEIKNYINYERNGDIVLGNLTAEEVLTYFSNITQSKMFNVVLTVTGTYSSYEFTSLINCAGYTNNGEVKTISVTPENVVF